MRMSLLKISIFGRFPFVRLIQIIDNPKYLAHMLRKRFVYRKEADRYLDKYEGFNFLSGQQTLEELICSGRSLGRYSDGEFDIISGGGIYPPDSNWSQRYSLELQRDLLKVLSSTNPRMLVAVDPPETFLASPDSVHSIPFQYPMWIDMRRLMWRYLQKGQIYGHSHLFVPANCPDLNWGMLRDHFLRKDVVIATGNTDKLRFLQLGRTTHFIECGTVNAYESREQIKQNIRDLIDSQGLDKKDVLVLASLGPTAQVIAHDFLDENICVWDTGHMFKFAATNLSDKLSSEQSAA
jgi:Glycosyltransferase GT-D fold